LHGSGGRLGPGELSAPVHFEAFELNFERSAPMATISSPTTPIKNSPSDWR
jgi:hypothetical protein